jgi:hypothetical protein
MPTVPDFNQRTTRKDARLPAPTVPTVPTVPAARDSAAEIDEILLQAAAEPKDSSGDGQSASSHPIPDLLKLADRLKGTDAAGPNGSAWSRLRAARVVPPGGGPC